MVRTKIEDTSDKVNKGTEWVRSSVFAPTHSILDVVETKFESVMLKTSSGMAFKLIGTGRGEYKS